MRPAGRGARTARGGGGGGPSGHGAARLARHGPSAPRAWPPRGPPSPRVSRRSPRVIIIALSCPGSAGARGPCRLRQAAPGDWGLGGGQGASSAPRRAAPSTAGSAGPGLPSGLVGARSCVALRGLGGKLALRGVGGPRRCGAGRPWPLNRPARRARAARARGCVRGALLGRALERPFPAPGRARATLGDLGRPRCERLPPCRRRRRPNRTLALGPDGHRVGRLRRAPGGRLL